MSTDETTETDPSRNPPAALKRQLFEEAGYRCAIPHCRETIDLEMAHIEPWVKVKEHVFENMIVLCHADHWRYDKKREIPKASLLAYKRNMAVINGRYNDFERRLLELLHERGSGGSVTLDYSPSNELHVRNLLQDGLVTAEPTPGASSELRLPNGGIATQLEMVFDDRLAHEMPIVDISGAVRVGGSDDYALTDVGRDFVERWFGAVLIDPA